MADIFDAFADSNACSAIVLQGNLEPTGFAK